MQNYANHRKFVPAFHFVALPILLGNFIYWVQLQVRWGYSNQRLAHAATGLALIIVAFSARVFALKVQDRVIRLEMRLKLAGLLPAELQPKIQNLTARQLVGLRFASNAELPSLVSQVLKDNITNADTIKKMIKDWQADDLRA